MSEIVFIAQGQIWYLLVRPYFPNVVDLSMYECANILFENIRYYPYRAFGDQNKIVYSTRFVTRRAILF